MWSRLISLPAPFFRRFTAGDGAARANGNQRHPPDVDRHRGAGRNQQPLLDVQPRAALLLLLPLGLAVTTCVFSYGRVRHYRDVFRMQGAIDGFVLQMINGVAKLRVANAESHALAHWRAASPSRNERLFGRGAGPRRSTRSRACPAAGPGRHLRSRLLRRPDRPSAGDGAGRLPVVQRRVRTAHGGGQQPDDRVDDIVRHRSAPVGVAKSWSQDSGMR